MERSAEILLDSRRPIMSPLEVEEEGVQLNLKLKANQSENFPEISKNKNPNKVRPVEEMKLD